MLERMIADLRKLGVRSGGVLLVHASLSSLGKVPGGPETVIRALLDAIGTEGTLLIPALSYDLVTPDQPVFDYTRTRSNIGEIPEYFRKRPETIRSTHPTHSVCGIGPKALELLADHPLDLTPVGPNSPFRKLPEYQGQILMLGCGLRPNTSMHGVEELMPPPYLFGGEQNYTTVDGTGATTTRRYTIHGFEGWKQRYDRLEQVLKPPALKTGKVVQASAHLIEASALWERVAATLSKHPLYFVDQA